MYASVSTAQIKPNRVATFTQRWREQIEPVVNHLSTLVDLYVLINPETDTLMLVGIYANEADALACQATVEYQQLFLQGIDLFVETLTHTGYTVILYSHLIMSPADCWTISGRSLDGFCHGSGRSLDFH